jgi:hypothetical protein
MREKAQARWSMPPERIIIPMDSDAVPLPPWVSAPTGPKSWSRGGL